MICRKKLRLLGYTLIEVMIAVSIIIVLISIVGFTGLKGSLEKSRDSKRKADLNKLARILEDYYNDNSRYPPPDPYFSGADGFG